MNNGDLELALKKSMETYRLELDLQMAEEEQLKFVLEKSLELAKGKEDVVEIEEKSPEQTMWEQEDLDFAFAMDLQFN
jgi:hypothetical protein